LSDIPESGHVGAQGAADLLSHPPPPAASPRRCPDSLRPRRVRLPRLPALPWPWVHRDRGLCRPGELGHQHGRREQLRLQPSVGHHHVDADAHPAAEHVGAVGHRHGPQPRLQRTPAVLAPVDGSDGWQASCWRASPRMWPNSWAARLVSSCCSVCRCSSAGPSPSSSRSPSSTPAVIGTSEADHRAFIGVISLCYLLELALVHPSWGSAARGAFIPHFDRASIAIAIG